jgi:cell wall assembly regulator SMI1
MTPLQLVQDACRTSLTTEDGDPAPLELMAPLSPQEIDAFEATLPCRLPKDIRDLLALCRGFTGGATDFVDFTGRDCSFEYEPAFPHGLPIAADGFGNFWVVDLLPTSTSWGPIYFACHDAPVILYQSPTLDHFLAELFKQCAPPYESLVDDVHEDRPFQVWATNPGALTHAECLQSGDTDLATFATELGPTFQLIDLRNPQIGFGFSWGRYGPKTVVRRFRDKAIFAYERPQSFFRRLFG